MNSISGYKFYPFRDKLNKNTHKSAQKKSQNYKKFTQDFFKKLNKLTHSTIEPQNKHSKTAMKRDILGYSINQSYFVPIHKRKKSVDLSTIRAYSGEKKRRKLRDHHNRFKSFSSMRVHTEESITNKRKHRTKRVKRWAGGARGASFDARAVVSGKKIRKL